MAYFLCMLKNKKVVKQGCRSNALVKRLALRGGETFVVFKDIKISLVPKALGIDYFFRQWKKVIDAFILSLI